MLIEDTGPQRPVELEFKACGEHNPSGKYAPGHQGFTGWGHSAGVLSPGSSKEASTKVFHTLDIEEVLPGS